jgi:RNA polymerase sigma-70 factor (ECF subfamily)
MRNEARWVSCRIFLAYLLLVDGAPAQPADEALTATTSAAPVVVHPALLDELWPESGAGQWGLDRNEFDRLILLVAMRQNFGLPAGAVATLSDQQSFFRNLKLADLVLASACASGNERAWEHFMATYGQQLTRAAIAISGSETVGRDLADAFYAELYGLNVRDGQRKCPLESYRGRGSLLGWLRTTLSQRFVDHYRRTFREEALDEQTYDAASLDGPPPPPPESASALAQAVRASLSDEPAEERFLLAAYYLDGRTLAEIGKLLRVHEATISRRLKRATESVRKRLLRHLEKNGMNHRAAEEVLGTDPRDLDLKMDLKKLLQNSAPETFPEQAPLGAVAKQTIAGDSLSNAGMPLANMRGSLSDKVETDG